MTRARAAFAGLMLLVGMTASATDITSSATAKMRFADWQVVEFAGRDQLIYRLASEALNFDNYTLVFDFAPSVACRPTPAVLVVKIGKYRPYLDGGHVPFSYRITGADEPETTELTETAMQKGDPFAFFAFSELAPQGLLATHQDARLAFWVPKNAQTKMESSSRIFFSLNGYDQAWARARTLCQNNG